MRLNHLHSYDSKAMRKSSTRIAGCFNNWRERKRKKTLSYCRWHHEMWKTIVKSPIVILFICCSTCYEFQYFRDALVMNFTSTPYGICLNRISFNLTVKYGNNFTIVYIYSNKVSTIVNFSSLLRICLFFCA